MNFRPIQQGDWEAIWQIQNACYPPIACERIEALQCHWIVSPDTCFVLAGDRGIAGYFLSHPWPRLMLPPLKKIYSSFPPVSDALSSTTSPSSQSHAAKGLEIAPSSGCSRQKPADPFPTQH